MTNTKKQTRPGNDRELKVHDGIVGAIILASVVAGIMLNPIWFWLAGATGAIMIQSAFTGFCPILFILGKLMSSDD